MHKRIIILGSTGSIGRAALEVIDALPDRFTVVGLVAGSRRRELAEQARRFDVAAVALFDESGFDELRRLSPAQTAVFAGAAGVSDLIAGTDANFVLSAITGVAGLAPTLSAIRRGIDVGIANKEALVVAGSILMPLARETGAKILPIDSEHSAVFQALHAGKMEEVRRVILTGSGGPFRTSPRERIESATVAEALRHPTWNMGPKITVDSATWMNKALEVIETQHLFGIKPEKIEVLIHPESIVHSMVEFRDGSTIAQLGAPDMKTPIQYALTYPDRADGMAPALDWAQIRRLHFEPPDFDRFPCLQMGFDAARAGGSSGAALNAANEAAVECFLAGNVRFGRIATVTGQVYARHRKIERPSLEDLHEVDRWARQEVHACIR